MNQRQRNYEMLKYLLFRQLSDGTYESLEITELSTPPDLPEVMKSQEPVSSHAQE